MKTNEIAHDGRIDVLGQARLVEGRAWGEVFVDLADGSTVCVVARQDEEGVIRVEIYNRNSVALDVFVDGERRHETLPF